MESISATALHHCYKQAPARLCKWSFRNFSKKNVRALQKPSLRMYVCTTVQDCHQVPTDPFVAVFSQHTCKCTTKQHKKMFNCVHLAVKSPGVGQFTPDLNSPVTL